MNFKAIANYNYYAKQNNILQKPSIKSIFFKNCKRKIINFFKFTIWNCINQSTHILKKQF